MDLEIKKELNDTVLTVSTIGRINSITAGELENTLKESYDSVSKIILDFKDLEYISSAGLRVVLAAYKAMTGNLVVRNSSKGVMEVFEMTGFTNIVTFE